MLWSFKEAVIDVIFLKPEQALHLFISSHLMQYLSQRIAYLIERRFTLSYYIHLNFF